MDMADLDITIESLMQQIKPFYRLLHGVLRNVLWNRINKFEPFDKASTIPAHMLGMKRDSIGFTVKLLIVIINNF